jgi:hypothetical protein
MKSLHDFSERAFSIQVMWLLNFIKFLNAIKKIIQKITEALKFT